VGLRAVLDAMVKRKIPSPCRDFNPRSSSPYLSAIPTDLSRLFTKIIRRIIVK
jgi:hypothetical protein